MYNVYIYIQCSASLLVCVVSLRKRHTTRGEASNGRRYRLGRKGDISRGGPGYSLQGGAVGGGVQRMGVVLYNKTSVQHHINHYNLFPLHPPLMNLEALPLGERPKRRAPRMLRVSRGNPCHMSIAAIIT